MMDISQWRASIGTFHLIRVANVLRRSKTKAPGDGKVDMTLCDILIFQVLILMLVKLCFCVHYNWISVNSQPFTVFERHATKGTMPGGSENLFDIVDPTSDLITLVQAPILLTSCAVYAVWLARKILLSNDVEVNPGPLHEKHVPGATGGEEGKGAGPEETGTGINMADILRAIEQQSKQMQDQLKCQGDTITKELSEIKTDLRNVSTKCEEINERCNKLEDKNHELAYQMTQIGQDVNNLCFESEDRKEECANLFGAVDELKQEVGRMNEELDRLEEHSRRDNLRIFGVPSVSRDVKETYDDCCEAVCYALNGVDGSRRWSEHDIVRAHRVGQARAGEPKPMIVKFSRWRDKMKLLRDKPLRGMLERKGVRVANDLTRRQMGVVNEAKREGKAAYFVRGKLTIGPRRADPRSYATVTGAGASVGHYSFPPFTQASSSLPPSERPAGDVRRDVTPSWGFPAVEQRRHIADTALTRDWQPTSQRGGLGARPRDNTRVTSGSGSSRHQQGQHDFGYTSTAQSCSLSDYPLLPPRVRRHPDRAPQSSGSDSCTGVQRAVCDRVPESSGSDSCVGMQRAVCDRVPESSDSDSCVGVQPAACAQGGMCVVGLTVAQHSVPVEKEGVGDCAGSASEVCDADYANHSRGQLDMCERGVDVGKSLTPAFGQPIDARNASAESDAVVCKSMTSPLDTQSSLEAVCRPESEHSTELQKEQNASNVRDSNENARCSDRNGGVQAILSEGRRLRSQSASQSRQLTLSEAMGNPTATGGAKENVNK